MLTISKRPDLYLETYKFGSFFMSKITVMLIWKVVKGMKNQNIKKVFNKILKRVSIILGYVVALNIAQQLYVFASDDPLTVVNNLSDFVFGLIRAVGMIILGFGVVQVGMSLKSHDPTQRANGIMTLAGGIVITFAKEILNLITGG